MLLTGAGLMAVTMLFTTAALGAQTGTPSRKGPATGSLRVLKTVVNATGAPAPIPATFAMTASCTSSSGKPTSTPFSVGPGPGYLISKIAENSACAVTEPPLPSIGHVPGCKGGSASWTTSYSPMVKIVANTTSTITVTNTLKCDPPPAGGHLTVLKTVVNTLGVTIPSAFNVVAHCTPSGPANAPLSVPSGKGVSLATPIAANSTCTVTEAKLASIPNVQACNGGSASWATSYSPPVTIVANTTRTITVTNTLKCDPTTLTVTKTIVPSNATGTFKLLIDGFVAGTGGNVGNGGTTGAVTVEATPHVVTEAASPGTNLADYTAVFGGDCNPTGHVTLAAGEAKTCTITNTFKVTHGTWTHGPGIATFTVCAYGTPCNVNGAPGASIAITIEAWGGGGGGGGGQAVYGPSHGGAGAGGGGGGGYGKTIVNVTVPSSGMVTYYIKVGAGGNPGQPVTSQASSYTVNDGGHGDFSEIRATNSSGTVLLRATGGAGGDHGHGGAAIVGGGGGTGTINNWAGLAGAGAALVHTCSGGGGGTGGPGGGPGRTGPGYINDGGNGGHGGYYNDWLDGCTAQSENNGLTAGAAGGNGLVKFVW